MNKFIVTTTIYKPSLAIERFSKLADWNLIIVGDLKTPHHLYEKNKNWIYLNPEKQIKINKKLSDLIGWNCIQRRNFGYIYALMHGAKYVASIDDDNIPYLNWGKEVFLEKKIIADFIKCKEDAFDPLSIFKFKNLIWHRGYPIELLQNREKYSNLKKIKKNINPDVQANLWDLNPDIDAINRMSIIKENYKFTKVKNYFSNKFSPFNSQNTIFSREAIKKYFLFPHIGRMDDIWAGYYLQSLGMKIIFSRSTVFQKRNYHNIYKDFLGEIIGYKNNLQLVQSLMKNPNSIIKFLPKRSYEAFKVYLKHTNVYK